MWNSLQPNRAEAPPQPPPVQAFRPRGIEPAVLEQFQRLEARASAADAAEWANERLAEAYEELWIQWWDGLRSSEDRMGDAAAFALGEIQLPELSLRDKLDHDIERGSSAGGTAPMRTRGWRALVRELRDSGWALDGLEWRMPFFAPPTELDGARARIAFEFHAARAEPVQRAIARGEAEVSWHPPQEGNQMPGIRSVRVARLEILRRAGAALFVAVARESLRPLPGMINIDPVLVLDLDGDARDEICLAGRNLVYRNLAGGFRSERLFGAAGAGINAAIAGDFNADGRLDFVAADEHGLLCFWGDGSGRFPASPERQGFPQFLNPWVFASGDVDGDGDLDLWLAQYKVPYQAGQMPIPFYDANDGFPAYLFLNDGRGRFADATPGSGLEAKRFRRTYSASWVDLDLDGDLDLINVSDFAGVDFFLNETPRGGRPRFRDATARLGEARLFGMAHAVADFDGNQRPDFLAIGMNSPVADRLDALELGVGAFAAEPGQRAAMAYGNRAWLNLGAERLAPAPWADQVARTGWSWGVSAEDFDNDGDLDIYVVNGHKSLASARDYETQFWTHDLSLATTTNEDPALALFFDAQATRFYGRGDSYGGHLRNRFFLRSSGGDYHECAWLLGLALPEDCRNVVAADLDNDGRLDLVITAVDFKTQPAQHTLLIYRNLAPSTRAVTVSLPPGAGAEFAGPPVVLELNTGASLSRWPITGGSYRSQGPQKAHFGLAPGQAAVRARRGGRTLEVPPLSQPGR